MTTITRKPKFNVGDIITPVSREEALLALGRAPFTSGNGIVLHNNTEVRFRVTKVYPIGSVDVERVDGMTCSPGPWYPERFKLVAPRTVPPYEVFPTPNGERISMWISRPVAPPIKVESVNPCKEIAASPPMKGYHPATVLVDEIQAPVLTIAELETLENEVVAAYGGRPKPADKWILILRNADGSLAPAEKPREYTTKKQASRVARDMAERHPGMAFELFKRCAIAKAPDPKAELVEF
jgi:hypothetical protein